MATTNRPAGRPAAAKQPAKKPAKKPAKPVRPKMVSARKAEKLRRKMYLRGPLDGWSFPLALASSLLFSSGRLTAAVRGDGQLDDALTAWGGALLFCWICWEVIASAMRSVDWDDSSDESSDSSSDDNYDGSSGSNSDGNGPAGSSGGA